MQCPKYIEFTRECQYKLGFLPLETVDYCSTGKHAECPFYMAIYNVGDVCKHMKYSPAYQHFKADNFEKFVEIANEYCLSEKNKFNCKRFKIRKGGAVPPADLMPDGSLFKK